MFAPLALVSSAVALTHSPRLIVSAPETAPVITDSPSSIGALSGKRIVFRVVAEGTVGGSTLSYQWFFNDEPLPGAAARRDSLAVVASAARAGEYHVVVTNAAGSTPSEPATLAIHTLPKFTAQPASVTLDAGQPLVLTVAASGTPAPSIQWLRDGVEIPDATNATFALDAVDALDTGSYRARLTNAQGSVLGRKVSVVVRSAPVIVDSPGDREVVAGSTVRLSVVAFGFPKRSYQWRRGGQPIPGARSATYSYKATLANAGLHDVVVSNSLGSDTSETFTVTVTAAPKITTQPVGARLRVGQAHTFAVVASGFPAPTFQWSKNGMELPGKTGSTLTIQPASADDAGLYSVRLLNASGGVTSRFVQLEVGLAPYAPVSGASFRLGGSYSTNFGDSGSVNETYTFKKGGVLRYEDFTEGDSFGLTYSGFKRVSSSQLGLKATTTIFGEKVFLTFAFTFTTATSGTYTLRGSAPSVGFVANQSGSFTYTEPGL